MRGALVRMMAALPAVMAAAILSASPGHAQACDKSSIAAQIDSASAQLGKLNANHQPPLQAKIRRLAEQRGWSSAEMNTKVADLLQDREAQSMDEQVANLLSDMDLLGDEEVADQKSCVARLAKLKTVSAQLVELTTAKAAHVSARLDAALGEQSPSTTATRPTIAPPAQTERKTAAAPPPRAPEPPAEQPPAKRTVPTAPPSPTVKSWETDTVHQSPPNEVANLSPPPDALRNLPPHLPQAAEYEYSVEEIRTAGRGFFGSISANLASVIEYAFQNYGRPNGYILGSEGGGAFLAGLRYGKGSLVSKIAGETPIFWQGPSFGYDLGIEGSRVMFLVYNMTGPDDLFARFGGVDGSAYLVGGVGITFLKKGGVVLAPIRTGLGLRVGANLGYLKFTPKPSLNPF